MFANRFSGMCISLVIAFALIPGAVHAQQGVGVNAGVAIPVGDLGDVSGVGFSIGGEYFTRVFDRIPNLRAGGRLAYNSFGDHDYSGFGADVSSSASTFEIVPSLRYLFPRENSRVDYFAQLGAGLYFTKLDFNNFPIDEDESDTNFGVTVGGGVTYRLLDTITAVAMPLYHITDKSYISLNVGFIFGRREAETSAAR